MLHFYYFYYYNYLCPLLCFFTNSNMPFICFTCFIICNLIYIFIILFAVFMFLLQPLLTSNLTILVFNFLVFQVFTVGICLGLTDASYHRIIECLPGCITAGDQVLMNSAGMWSEVVTEKQTWSGSLWICCTCSRWPHPHRNGSFDWPSSCGKVKHIWNNQ